MHKTTRNEVNVVGSSDICCLHEGMLDGEDACCMSSLVGVRSIVRWVVMHRAAGHLFSTCSCSCCGACAADRFSDEFRYAGSVEQHFFVWQF